MDIEISILPDGTIKYLYYDEFKFLVGLGHTEISRASHVEPVVEDSTVNWYVDLSPVNGPELGPFESRDSAIIEEIEWLQENYLCKYDK
jgi:hypothetical protein